MKNKSHGSKEVIEFIEYLTLSGDYIGKPFVLREWQKDIIRSLFDTRTEEGLRAYTDCGVWLPRKNAKTELAAALAAYFICCEPTQGEIYSAAGDSEQAGIVFNKTAGMIDRHPQLRKVCKIIWHMKRIINNRTGTVFSSISAEEGTKHGYNASMVIADEIHVWKKRGLWTALTTGSDTRKERLFLTTTTAGIYDPESLEWELYEYAKKVKDGIIKDDAYLPVIYAAEQEDDWLDEEVWHKVNPALGDFRSLDAMRKYAERAQSNTRLENDFRRLYLNQHTQQVTRWIPMEKWEECQVDEREIEHDATVYAGLDLSTTVDLSAWCLAVKDGDNYKLQWRFWIPEDRMVEIERDDRVPYSQWVREGWVTPTKGGTIDYSIIIRDILIDAKKYNLMHIGFDPWNATATSQQLEQEGFDLIKIRQGAASLSEPSKELERAVLCGELDHGNNPVARWMASNVEVNSDTNGNIRPVRPKHGASRRKIDGIVAAIMAIKLAQTMDPGTNTFENLGALWQ